MNKKKKVLLSFFTVSGLLIFTWFVFNGLFFAYCSDAYVRAHVAEISKLRDATAKGQLPENMERAIEDEIKKAT